MSVDPVVRVSGVVAGYGDAREAMVLTGVDLSVDAGEHIALLGPNGSGKSTLLRVVAGTLRPMAGSVELFGRPIGSWRRDELARAVTVLPQNLELPAGFRVSEVVALGRIPHATSWFAASPDDEAAVERALVDADVEALAGRRVDALSGGERQRVLLALALAQEPRLLLLDEPTAHLDLAHQLALVSLLGRLRRARRLTVIAVLHDLNVAARVADRAVLLGGGRLREAGHPPGSLDPTRLSDAFGVPIVEARAPDGSRVLVPRVPERGDLRIPD